MVSAIQAKNLFHLLQSDKEVSRPLAWEQYGVDRFARRWRSAGGADILQPTLPQEFSVLIELDSNSSEDEDAPPPVVKTSWRIPVNWRDEAFSNWVVKPVQGVGNAGFKSLPESNA